MAHHERVDPGRNGSAPAVCIGPYCLVKGIGLVFLGSLFLERQLSLGVPTDRRFVCFYFTLAVLYCGFTAAERAADAPARHGGLGLRSSGPGQEGAGNRCATKSGPCKWAPLLRLSGSLPLSLESGLPEGLQILLTTFLLWLWAQGGWQKAQGR